MFGIPQKSFFLLIILLLAAVLRLPSLVEPYWHGDEGITLAVAQEISRGETLYQEISDNKPPLLYLVAARAGTLFNLRLLTTIWVVFGLTGFWLLSLNFFSPVVAGLVTTTATFGLSLPGLEANIVNGEIWFIPLTIWGMFLLTSTHRPLGLAAAGTLFGFGTLFKMPVVLDAAAAVLFIAGNPSSKNTLTKTKFFLLGLSLPWLATLTWLYFRASLPGFFQDGLVNNLIYTGTWGSDPWFPHSRLFAKGIFLGLTGFVVWRQRLKLTPLSRLVILWLTFTFVATLLSNRPYRHYALQLLPALTLAGGLILKGVRTRRTGFSWAGFTLTLSLGVGATIFLGWFFKFGLGDLYNQAVYYRRFLNPQDEQAFLVSFDPQIPDLYRTAAMVTHFTKPQDNLFVWGNFWLLYPLSQRPLVAKYPADFVIHDLPGATQLTSQLLQANPPTMIVLTDPQRYELPGLAKLLRQSYDHVAQVNHVSLYQKI